MKNRKNAASLMLIALVAVCLFVFFASALASGHISEHTCTGDDCLVCLAISVRESSLRPLIHLACVITLVACLTVTMLAQVRSALFNYATETPVCLKVKLSD